LRQSLVQRPFRSLAHLKQVLITVPDAAATLKVAQVALIRAHRARR
jgi:hypothetical protein